MTIASHLPVKCTAVYSHCRQAGSRVDNGCQQRRALRRVRSSDSACRAAQAPHLPPHALVSVLNEYQDIYIATPPFFGMRGFYHTIISGELEESETYE